MTNREVLQSEINKLGFKFGCYGKGIDSLSKKSIKTIVDNLYLESTDIQITDKRVKYIVTIDTVDDEKDLSIKTLQQYESQFGEIENR